MGKGLTETAADRRDTTDMSDAGEALGVFLARNSVEPIGPPEPAAERAGDDAEAPPPTLLELARTHAFDPSIFEEHPPYFWRAHVSNNQVDAYFTRMHATSLQNYAADAAAGVSFQNSHVTRQLGVGRSISGRYSRGGGVNPARTEADFYTIPDLRLNSDMGTNDFILGVRSGLIHDVSIGFYGGEYRCSICQRDMLRDWDCWHIPGFRYAADGKKADVKDTEASIAVAWIHDAHLSEVSCVYDGATPGAAILKAQRESSAGRMPETAIRLVEMRYRVHLPDRTSRMFPVTDLSKRDPGDEHVIDEVVAETEPIDAAVDETVETRDAPAEEIDQVDNEVSELESDEVLADIAKGELMFNSTREGTSVKTQTPAKTDEAADDGARTYLATDALLISDVRRILKNVDREAADDVLNAILELTEEVVRLRPEAEDGRAYREALIKEAIEAGVRAHGNEFATETYQGVLEKSSIPTIMRFRDDWGKTAVGNGLTGGRKTREGADEGTPAAETAKNGTSSIPVPDGAFRA